MFQSENYSHIKFDIKVERATVNLDWNKVSPYIAQRKHSFVRLILQRETIPVTGTVVSAVFNIQTQYTATYAYYTVLSLLHMYSICKYQFLEVCTMMVIGLMVETLLWPQGADCSNLYNNQTTWMVQLASLAGSMQLVCIMWSPAAMKTDQLKMRLSLCCSRSDSQITRLLVESCTCA